MIKQNVSNLSVNLRFRCLEVHLPLAIPDAVHVDDLLLVYCLPCLSRIDINILVDLFLFLLVEEFVFIYSTDSNILSQIIMLLLCAIQPPKCPFLVIANLPMSMVYIVESPFPSIVGTSSPG
jgi:hypothetical protein